MVNAFCRPGRGSQLVFVLLALELVTTGWGSEIRKKTYDDISDLYLRN